MKKWNWKNLLPPPMLIALLFASCNLIQEMPQDFVETYGNIAYVEKVDYVGLAENVESGEKPKVTETKNFKIIYSIRNDGNFDLSPEFAFEGCQIKNPHVDTEKKRVSLTVPGEELKALADGADFKVKLTLYKASQKVLQSAYELDMRYVYTGGPETPKGKVEIKIPGLDLPDGYKVDLKNETADFKVEQDDNGSWVVKTTEGGVSEGKHELELVVKDEDGNVLKDGDGNDITIKIEVDVSAGSTTSDFTEKDDEKSLDKFIEEVEKKIEEIGKTPPEESKNPTTEPETPKGTVEVKVEVPDGYELEIEGENKDKFEVKKDENGSYTIVTKEEGGLPEGKYELELVVKDEETGEETPIGTKEIEVSSGETTGGFTGEPDDTTFEITAETIEDKKKDVVYVRGADGSYASKYPDAKEGSDDNSGTLLSPFATIQKAIDTIIERNDGTSPYTIYIDGTLTQSAAPSDGKDGMADFSALDKDLKLTIKALPGTAPNETQKATLNAGGKSRVINASPSGGTLNLTLENLVIKGGKAAVDGGGIFVANGTTLTMNGTITGNTAQQGGGVYVTGDTGVFTMTGGEISDNHTTTDSANGNENGISGGGIFIYNGAKANISGTTISNNTSNNNGGGIHVNGGTLTIGSGTIISGNNAEKYGGGVYVNDIFNMDGGTISGNTAQQDGGGVYVTGGTFTMSGGIISGNEAKGDNGGGICLSGGAFTMDGSTSIISGNKSSFGGGVQINNDGIFTMKNGTISENEAIGNGIVGGGGGVHVYKGTFNMSGGTISKNKCLVNTEGSGGGGVYVYTGQKFTISDNAKISGNTAAKDGGGVYSNNGDFTMTGGTIGGDTDGDKNTAQYGGGVYLMAGTNTFTMNGGEISGNKASEQGGGVYVNSATFSMSGNAKVNGNTATNSGGGIYVYKDPSSTTDAIFTMGDEGSEAGDKNSEISGNTATNNDGGGIYNQGGDATIHSGTISGNNANTDGGGVYIASGLFTMEKGMISNNTAQYGGGVYIKDTGKFIMYDVEIIDNLNGNGVWSKGTFEMNDGTISGHSVSGKGGGVYAAGGSFTMNGGTISGNNATSDGNGAYIDCTFNMSGDAKFDENNDIYLSNSNKINITDALSESKVATITLPDEYYRETKQVLSAGTGVTITQGICDKFAVTPQTDGTKWKVALNGTTAGVLKKDNVDVGGSGGISVTVPDLGKNYTFVIDGISDEGNGKKKLYGNGVITLSEVTDSSGQVAGTFTIEIRDGETPFPNASATGSQPSVTVPTVPVEMSAQIYVKVELSNGYVIDETIPVTIMP